MYKAYKFRLYPDKIQKEKLNKSFDCNRFVYNYYLSMINILMLVLALRITQIS